MNLYTINTGYFKLDGGAMFGVVPKTIWQKQHPADSNNRCSWAMRSLLIEDGKRLILVDTGIGNKQDDQFFAHYFLHGEDSLVQSIRAAGFMEDEITDVVLTHLHFDHVGGAVVRRGERLEPLFKNAVYWTNEPHWQWAIAPNEREKPSFLKENLLPLQDSGQLRFIDNTLALPLGEHITLRFVYGHTEAMMLPQIRYKNQTIVFVSDLFPSVAHLPIPYIMAYDMFPLKTLQEKTDFLQEAATNHYVLLFQHDPVHECCSLHQTEKGIRAQNVFSLQSI